MRRIPSCAFCLLAGVLQRSSHKLVKPPIRYSIYTWISFTIILIPCLEILISGFHDNPAWRAGGELGLGRCKWLNSKNNHSIITHGDFYEFRLSWQTPVVVRHLVLFMNSYLCSKCFRLPHFALSSWQKSDNCSSCFTLFHKHPPAARHGGGAREAAETSHGKNISHLQIIENYQLWRFSFKSGGFYLVCIFHFLVLFLFEERFSKASKKINSNFAQNYPTAYRFDIVDLVGERRAVAAPWEEKLRGSVVLSSELCFLEKTLRLHFIMFHSMTLFECSKTNFPSQTRPGPKRITS